MLNWLFKKRPEAPAPTPAPRPARPAAAAAPAATAKAVPGADVGADWPARLQAAQGDDAALLRLAQSTAPLETKLAAVAALATEAALKQAERAFRSHDRKVHRIAKQRLEAAVAEREARAQAHLLLERTAALTAEAEVPINHVVELDRAWAALPAHCLEPAQRQAFAERRERLDAALQARGEAQQRLSRWTADAKRCLPPWRQAVATAAEHGAASDIAALRRDVEALRQSRPDAAASEALDQALAQLLQAAVQVEARLAWLEAPPVAPGAADLPEDADPPVPAPPWNALPALTDTELARVLTLRHVHWLQAHSPAPPAAAEAPPAPARAPRPARAPAPTAEQRLQLEALVQQAETALAEGQLGPAQQQLQAIDDTLATMDAAALPAEWRTRHQALRAEHGRLKGWQQWGGSRARDDLTAEAEALGRQTLAAAEPDAPEAPKLNLKLHAESIQTLRQRWKELDRLGAGASAALWQRFDAALHAAYQPVAAQQAVLKAARQDNLAVREALLGTLEALPLPGTTEDAPVPDWRDLVRELERFQQAWRKLGPAEHTVPAAARQALGLRLRAAVERIETPLHEVQREAAAAREQMIARAEALAPPSGSQPPPPDAALRVRDLQADWQHHARQLPLPRGLEAALWARFKAATDAVFAQREAAFAARGAELDANLAQREALLARLTGLSVETPPNEIERTLADVDRAWRQAGDVPRDAADALERRLREAHAAALGCLDAAARLRWLAQCDTLAAKLAVCEAREDGSADADELGRRWAALGALPASWEQALAGRWERPVAPGPLAAAAIDESLLHLETVLALPASPEWQDARRQLKLRALKEAMEGRSASLQGPAQPADRLLAAIGQAGLGSAQRARLQALVAALRQAPPGVIGAPVTRA